MPRVAGEKCGTQVHLGSRHMPAGPGVRAVRHVAFGGLQILRHRACLMDTSECESESERWAALPLRLGQLRLFAESAYGPQLLLFAESAAGMWTSVFALPPLFFNLMITFKTIRVTSS